ncbi:ribosomal protein S19 [Hamiltosporidium tvaerminnensis]|uniref:Ribosomal protein S19 n=2 Tax=Hamiltosporidium TaxID=1176354 RepID=A0A4Q9KYW9_9MICR|nr:Rps19ep [Hamiltosporidium tvaerminnensis]TBT96794.1 ribosomal protein S19 [Hamiltosporidium magnivora]TBT99705.1 ribosomal protein S19 [Hamiltosporidium tvaerminnensis]TBT99854.1 ribosomal protein S19 [Hamiltosporidium magnivora]
MSESIYQVTPESFISNLSLHLKSNQIITQPPNISILKTSHAKQLPPTNTDWIFVRASSIIRSMLINISCSKYTSISLLANKYGCSKNRGCRPSRKVRASLHPIQWILKDLEKKGWVVKCEKGRTLSEECVKEMGQLIEKIKNNE